MKIQKIKTLVTAFMLLVSSFYSGNGYTDTFSSSSTIVPESRIQPLTDHNISKKFKIETALWFSLKQTPDLYSRLIDKSVKTINYRYKLGKETVDCNFSRSRILWSGKERDEKTIVFIPCKIENISFGAYLLRDQLGMIRLFLCSREEQAALLSALKNMNTGTQVEKIEKALLDVEKINRGINVPDIHVLKKGDIVLSRVNDFLEAIGAGNLRAGLNVMADNDQILAADGLFIVSPGIIINNNDKDNVRAESMLSQLLTLVDGGISFSDIQFYRKALMRYINDPGSFEAQSSIIKERVSYFEKDLSLSDFNKYSEFMDVVGEQKLKTSHKVHGFLLKSVERDIQKALDKIAANLDRPEECPIKNIKIGSISQAVVPPAIVDDEYTLIVNENFARCLWILKDEFDLADGPGDVSFVSSLQENKELEFNLYDTLIYSFVINHINRASIVNKGTEYNWAKDMEARGEFGEKYGYINLLGYLYYKYLIAEMGEGLWGDDIKAFLYKHPELWRKFRNTSGFSSEEQVVDGIKTDLFQLKSFFEKTRYDKAPVHIDRFPREHVVSYLDVFDFFCRNKHKPWSIEDLYAFFGGRDQKTENIEEDSPIKRAVDFLERTGVVNGFEIVETAKGDRQYAYQYIAESIKQGKEPVRPSRRYYMAAPLDEREQMPGIINFLNEYKTKAIKIEDAKTRVLDLIGENWTRTFLGNIRRVINEAGVFRDGYVSRKILIGLETGWVPEGQKEPIGELRTVLRQLELNGIVEIVEGDADSIGSIISKRMRKEELVPGQVIALVSRETLEHGNIKEELGFKGDGENDPFIAGVDPSNLGDDSYIRLMEMLVMALRRSFKILPIAEHPDIEVVFNKDGTVIFIPSAEPLGDLAEKYYIRQRKVLLSA